MVSTHGLILSGGVICICPRGLLAYLPVELTIPPPVLPPPSLMREWDKWVPPQIRSSLSQAPTKPPNPLNPP